VVSTLLGEGRGRESSILKNMREEPGGGKRQRRGWNIGHKGGGRGPGRDLEKKEPGKPQVGFGGRCGLTKEDQKCGEERMKKAFGRRDKEQDGLRWGAVSGERYSGREKYTDQQEGRISEEKGFSKILRRKHQKGGFKKKRGDKVKKGGAVEDGG